MEGRDPLTSCAADNALSHQDEMFLAVTANMTYICTTIKVFKEVIYE